MAAKDAHVLELAGREIRITSPDKVLFAGTRRRSSTSSPTTRPSPGRSCARWAAGRCSCSGSRRAPAVRRSSRSACRERAGVAADDDRADGERHAVAALVAADVAHVAWAVNLACLGFHVWPYLRRRPRACRRTAPRPRPPAGYGLRRGARRRLGAQGAARRARHRRLPQDDRQPRPARLRPPAAAVGLLRGPLGGRRRRARARAPPPGHPHRRLVEGGARRAIFVDYNQNAPHKTVFGAWSVRARKGAQVDAALLGRARRHRPDALTMATVPGRVERDGDPWAASTTRRSRSSRSSRCTSATGRTASSTRRGRPSTPSSPTSRRASPRAAPGVSSASRSAAAAGDDRLRAVHPDRPARPRRRADGHRRRAVSSVPEPTAPAVSTTARSSRSSRGAGSGSRSATGCTSTAPASTASRPSTC